MYIPSVSDATTKIVRAYQKEDFDALEELRVYLKEGANKNAIAGSADEFHNAAVNLSRYDFYQDAYELLAYGLNRYGKNVDLLADMLAYGVHCKPIDGKELLDIYKRLQSINKRFWTWRGYQFSFDYLLEKMPYAKNDEELAEIEKEILKVMSDFDSHQKYLTDKSDVEKAFMVKYDYYMTCGEEEKAIEALQKATESVEKCVQCALKLADYYFGTGEYKLAAKYAEKAANVKEDQDSVNKGYLYYIWAMSLEQDARNADSNGIPQDEITIKKIYQVYETALVYWSDVASQRERQIESIKRQVRLLEKQTGIPSYIEFETEDKQAILNFLKSQLGDMESE